MQIFKLKPFVAIILSTLALQAHAASSYTDIGYFSGGSHNAPYGISANGNAVVGNADDSSGYQHGYRWTSDGMVDLGFFPSGNNNTAKGISADGNVVVGTANLHYVRGPNDYPNIYQAYRWTSNTGLVGLGYLAGGNMSSAWGISADGNVVVGQANTSDYNYQAMRWSSGTGMVGIGNLPGYDNGQAYAASANGDVIVGASVHDSTFNHQAFRWTSAGLVGLGYLPGGNESQARGVSANGNVVVGESTYDSTGNQQAIRWTSAGMVGLGFLDGGKFSLAAGVSADGSVVVGQSSNSANNTQAFRWTNATGMQSITQWLAAGGVTAPASLAVNNAATAISANGNVVTGRSGNGSFAWVARVDPAGSGFLPDINAYNRSLMRAAPNLPNLAMFGAHHRSILDNGLAKTSSDGACGWATADGGRYDNIGTREQLIEVGVCKDFGTTRVGVGIGQAWLQQNLSLNGSARYDGQYLLAEGAKQFDNGLQPSVTGYYGHFDAKMARNYVNGASVDSSAGNSEANGYALRARLDWKDAAQLGHLSLSPYAAYTWMKTKVGGYTETGGGFPAYFAASSLSTDDVRIGLAANTPLSSSTDLRLGAEVVHRLEENISGINGQLIGLWSFSVNTPQITQNWTRATVDLDHRFTDKIAMTLGALGATSGNDASWSVTAGLRANF